MKRKLLIFTIIIAILAYLVPINNVKATNGPSNDYAFICFASMTDYKEIYQEGEIHNDAMEGVTYDLESNTLTLENVNTTLELGANKMGDDFKIKVVGENNIPMICAYGDNYGGSLTITGDGVLNIDTTTFGLIIPEGSDEQINAITLYAENDNAVLTIEDTVTVNINAQSNAICIWDTPNSNTNSVITLNNGQNLNITKQDNSYNDPVRIQTIKAEPYNDFTETYTLCTKDGKTYGLTAISSQVYVTSAQITYVEPFGKYYTDPTSTEEYMNQVFDSVEAVEEAGYVITDEEVTIDGYLETSGDWGEMIYQDENGTSYVYYNYYNNGDYEQYVYDISDYDIVLSDEVPYKVLSENTEVDADSLHPVYNEVKTGNFDYIVSAKTLSIAPNQEGENEPAVEENPVQEENNNAEETDVKVETVNDTEVDKAVAEEVTKLVDAIVAKDEGTVDGVDEELANKIREKVEAGETILVEVSVQAVETEDIAQDVEKIAEKVSETSAKVAAYFDIDVIVKTADETLGNVTSLQDKVTLTLPIPTDLPVVPAGYTRIFTVMKVHDGVVTELATTQNGNNVSVESDEFSTYALTYKDVANTSNPQTGDNIIISFVMFAIATAGAVTIAALRKRK